MPRQVKRYGWRRDLPDQRDFLYTAPAETVAALPAKVDLRPTGFMPPVYDQGQLGSCTANAIGGAVQFDLARQKLHVFRPSRLFVYYNERVIEGSVDQDAGAEIRDGFKTIAAQGACPEWVWPYDIAKFAEKPPQAAYDAATGTKAVGYARVAQTPDQMKGCLAAGYPFVIGFTVYQSFESAQVAGTGVVPMPRRHESVLGGHAILVVGYDDAAGVWIGRNSWSSTWGDKGYFYMPYAYFLDPNLSSDLWTVRLLS